MNLLVLSPHRDDAAFSLALSITHWLDVGHRVTVLNVFTRSLYAPYSDADTVHVNDRLGYISALRKREDQQFLKQIPGALFVDLNLKDAPIRLQCDDSVVCDLAPDYDDPAIAKIQKALAKFADGPHGVSAFVLPLALGHHVDHRIVRDASLPQSASTPCAFYEDLPYAARPGVQVDPASIGLDAAARLNEPLYPVLCHGKSSHPSVFKRRVALLYASQINAELADTMAKFCDRYGGAERLWANSAWMSAARAEDLSTPAVNPDFGPSST